MQDYQELVPDAEMFARVWKRVMPDESLSRIEVHTSDGQKEYMGPPELTTSPPPDDRELLWEVLEEMDRGQARAGEIRRRDPGAWPLGENMERSSVQLRAAWLLLTGQRWNATRYRPVSGNMAELLREQYLWELRFSELCRQAGKKLQRADVAEVMPEQESASVRRRRMLRHMLGGGK